MLRLALIGAVFMVLLAAACVEGPVGPDGPVGPQGEQGVQGETGPQGEQGPIGLTGEKGDTGDTGERGPQGDTGPQGERGSVGAQGIPGEPGPKGDTGARGVGGPVGPAGAKGNQGQQGERGPRGLQGTAGQRGAIGLTGPAGRDAADFAAVYKNAADSVVCVNVTTNETAYFCGTGFYVDRVGTVLTAYHVVEFEGQTTTNIEMINQAGGRTEYRLQRKVDSLDAALLVPKGGRVSSTPLTFARDYSLGQSVMAMGYSSNLIEDDVLLASSGVISGTAGWGSGASTVRYIVMDVGIARGASGGPVLNNEGEVIGFLRYVGLDDPFGYAVSLIGAQLP